MMNWSISVRVILLSTCICVPGFPDTVRANDTSMHSGESGPEPVGWISGEESIVQMVSEHLTIHFGRDQAEVSVKFTFRSHKETGVARQTLGFPDEYHIKGRDWDMAGPLEDMRTFVNGEEVESKLKHGFISISEDQKSRSVKFDHAGELDGGAAWWTIDVEFPPGEDVIVERRYRTALGQTAGGPHFFSYTTFTGGNWHGKIEKLTADIHLLDGLTVKDIQFRGYTESMQPPSLNGDMGEARKVSPTRLHLEWKSFEPREESDRQGFRIDWWSPQTVELLKEIDGSKQ